MIKYKTDKILKLCFKITTPRKKNIYKYVV